MSSTPRGWLVAAMMALILVNVFVFRKLFDEARLKISTLSVTQGGAVLVQTPNRQLVLIDTGPDASILRALGENMPPWKRNIDEIILTSDGAGVAGGLSTVQSRYAVGYVAHLPTSKMAGREVQQLLRISYGNTAILVDENGVSRAGSAGADLLISSSTLSSTYVSDGQHVYNP